MVGVGKGGVRGRVQGEWPTRATSICRRQPMRRAQCGAGARSAVRLIVAAAKSHTPCCVHGEAHAANMVGVD
jgi:hypothetical protein|eukprot:COSAG01_NODE_1657_length_9590_cov_441.132336_9_plen_72_part_00